MMQTNLLVSGTCLFVSLAALVALTGCHANVNGDNLPTVEYAEKKPMAADSPSNQVGSGSQITYEANIEKERAVADGCLQAWRKAVAGDEKTAMKMLEDLDKKFTGISSVQFMMGQVKEHFGKQKEAVAHYQQALSINDFSSMQTFKLAESMRKAGDAKGSLVYYQKLIGNLDRATGDYGRDDMKQLLVSVRLGLAHAYKDCKQDQDALAEVKKILELDPVNAEGKSLLKELEKTAG